MEDKTSEAKALETKQQSPRIRDGLAVFIAVIVVWLGIGFLLAWLGKYLSQRSIVYVSGFLTQGSMALVIGVFLLWRGINLQTLGFRKISPRVALSAALKAYGIVFVLNIIYGLALTWRNLQPTQPTDYNILLGQHDIVFVLLNFLLAALIAPILEETLFRGIIYKSLRSKFGMGVSAVLSSILFSGLHFDLWGFIPRFFLGIALAYLYEKKGSLFPGITLHALNNVLALLLNLAVKMPT